MDGRLERFRELVRRERERAAAEAAERRARENERRRIIRRIRRELAGERETAAREQLAYERTLAERLRRANLARVQEADRVVNIRREERERQQATVTRLRTQQQSEYGYAVRRYARITGQTYNQARSDAEFKHWRRVLAGVEERVLRGETVDRSPNGLYAEALEHLRYREVGASWNVGETPKIRARPA